MNRTNKIIIGLVIAAVALVAVIVMKDYRTMTQEHEELDEVALIDSVQVEEIRYKYGIPVDDYDVNYLMPEKTQYQTYYWNGSKLVQEAPYQTGSSSFSHDDLELLSKKCDLELQ